jgi:hypothetical protein
MPPELWTDSPLDISQRHARYIQAAETIEALRAELAEARRERDALRILLESAGDMLHECGLRDEIFAVVDAARKGAP